MSTETIEFFFLALQWPMTFMLLWWMKKEKKNGVDTQEYIGPKGNPQIEKEDLYWGAVNGGGKLMLLVKHKKS